MTTTPDPAFVALARAWIQAPTNAILALVWTAYDDMQARPPAIDTRDLERSITQRLSHHVRTVPAGKPYPKNFTCHHLMLEFSGLKRHT